MAKAPFRAKVEERAAALPAAPNEDEAPAKRACSQFDQKINKLPAGDLSLVKDQIHTSLKVPKLFAYILVLRSHIYRNDHILIHGMRVYGYTSCIYNVLHICCASRS